MKNVTFYTKLSMNKRQYLMLEAIMSAPDGITREEINNSLLPFGYPPLNRKRFFAELKQIRESISFKITSRHYGKNVWRYTIDIKDEADRNHAEHMYLLIANLHESQFLNEFRQLGTRIQPTIIPSGNRYLGIIGTAMTESKALQITYQKFSDTEPYTTIIHPYTLKAFQNRWYLLAMKAEEGILKHFALDRIQSLIITEDTFTISPTFNATEYYTHFFSIYVDNSLTPEDIHITTTPEQAHYFRTLPLHHSQKELPSTTLNNGIQQCHFTLHICITPDFELEMKKYSDTTKWEKRG